LFRCCIDIWCQCLVMAALRAGRQGLARSLLAERKALKPSSPLTDRWLAMLAK
jgi:phage shock protein A